ncbi:PREDICTED: uncharacterized protein LOC108373708 [Rhagoletis zephyria]|uniref:uncharacterized protein LOC108373708 n=1 Tax=Rhagoletis zephyria TaxID=28612 RepID=UPI0008118ECA|nr:PREDICTED: uncharacterized protein LOC108373708 [Rhagoletis zephyria]
MDGEPMSFTSLALMLLLLIAIVMFACHCLGPHANTWMRSNKEEKIGLSKNKLFHANGYMIHSGSEFLLSNSGSFKRFDTIDKDDYRQSGQQPTHHATTPLWNLAGEGEVDANIPPQPLRPAPAPGTQTPASAGHIKTVTFSFEQINETTTPTNNGGGHRFLEQVNSNSRASNSDNASMVSCMRSSMKTTNAPIPKPIEAPPPPRLSAAPSSALSATAIPRPVAKRHVSLQNVGIGAAATGGHVDTIKTTTTIQETEALPTTTTTAATTANGERSHLKALKRRNSSTNPFLCESADSLPESNTALSAQQTSEQQQQQKQQQFNTLTNKQNSSNYTNSNINSNNGAAIDVRTVPAAATTTSDSAINGSCNPFYSELTNAPDALTANSNNTAPTSLSAKSLQQQFQEFRNRSFSTTEATEDADLSSLSSGLRRLTQNSTNPFTGLSQRVQKGPHMLQKTISEDFLFRKLGVSTVGAQAANCTSVLSGNGNGSSSISGSGSGSGSGNTTWTFGRSLLRQDSLMSLGRRNSSQCSLDSTACGSLEGINLERAISCDSVNSDTSSVFVGELDQPYTQITGYLCVGLQYDKYLLTVPWQHSLPARHPCHPCGYQGGTPLCPVVHTTIKEHFYASWVFKDSVTPGYNETFNFWLKKQHGRHSLWFHLYHNGDAHTLIGEAEMEIGEMPRSVTTWIPLTDSRKCNAQWGELMFSLSYLPTAERLTIVIVKARNLKMEIKESGKNGAPQEVQSVFVKVYLMNNEKKVLKKRTSLKRRDRCPIFNESMIFSVPPPSLTTVQLRLTVFGVTDAEDGAPRIAPIGHVIAGACATGKGLRHWHQMLSSLRKPVAMWHVLRRASYQPIFTGGAEAVVAAMQSNALRAKRNSII